MDTFGIIKQIQFGVMSAAEIKERSVLEVYHVSMLSSSRLGVLSKSFGSKKFCETCGGSCLECPGHFGHLSLSLPVFHFGFLGAVVHILRCICFCCSKLRLSKNDIRWDEVLSIEHRRRRLRYLDRTSSLVIHCKECTKPHATITRSGMLLRYKFDPPNDEDNYLPLSPGKALGILERISDEDCTSMGLNPKWNRPEWMILSQLPIPPPHVTYAPGADSLVAKLAEIIKVNENLKIHLELGSPQRIITEFHQLLQLHIATYMFTNVPGQKALPPLSRPYKTLQHRLGAKDGRIRRDLMGKRVNFSACSVVTPDPHISISEVGVPRVIAMKLTIPERVTQLNRTKIRNLTINGPTTYPGAARIVHKDGSEIDLRTFSATKLEVGDVVERHLQDGDYVVLNRQPSVNRQSIMGHRVRVMSGLSFRINTSLTTPYNVDFDGDAMIMHVPQSLETMAEVSELLAVPNHIISPTCNRPAMGIISDSLLGSYLLTKRDTFIEKDVVMNMLMFTNDSFNLPIPAILKPRTLWTGKQIFSRLIPRHVNLMVCVSFYTNGTLFPDDDQVIIEQGELLAGYMCKRVLGTTSGGLIQTIRRASGKVATRVFVDQTQEMVNCWLMGHGFGFGIQDMITNQTVETRIRTTITNIKRIFIDSLEQAESIEMWEKTVNGVAHQLQACRWVILRSMDNSNYLGNMATAGSLALSNIEKMIASLGMQNVSGNKLIPNGFLHRTLPHFTKYDYSSLSRGFAESSLLRGLSPPEFFFHALSAHDQATSASSHLQKHGRVIRGLVKITEDVRVAYDGTVRNARGEVVQFVYGQDGRDPSQLEQHQMQIRSNTTEFEDIFVHSSPHGMDINSVLIEGVHVDYTDPATRAALQAEEEDLREDQRMLREDSEMGSSRNALPWNLHRIVRNAQKRFQIDPRRSRSNLTPIAAVQKVKDLCGRLGVDNFRESVLETSLMCMALRNALASKRVVMEYRLTSAALDWVAQEVEKNFVHAAVHPGEMVGVIAAACIQPPTQLYFYTPGISRTALGPIGMPRLTELLCATTAPRTSCVATYLLPSEAADTESALTVTKRMKYIPLHDLLESYAIYYDPDLETTVISEDAYLVRLYVDLPDDDDCTHEWSAWVIRMEFDRTTMADNRLVLADVEEGIRQGVAMQVMYCDDSAERLIMRVRLARDEREGDSTITYTQLVSNHLLNARIRGIPGISKALLMMDHYPTSKPQWIISALTEEGEATTEHGILFDILRVSGVDSRRTICNDPAEVAKVFGIEAARAVLVFELHKVISYDGAYFDPRHLSLLADVMTHHGYITSIGGPTSPHPCTSSSPFLPLSPMQVYEDSGPLKRCSCGEPTKALMDSSVFSDRDDIQEVAARIMLGQLAPIGTASFEVLSSENKIFDC